MITPDRANLAEVLKAARAVLRTPEDGPTPLHHDAARARGRLRRAITAVPATANRPGPGEPCPTCGHVQRATVTRIPRARSTAPCADPRACWDWQHTCRTRIKHGPSSAPRGMTYQPASYRGREIPQADLLEVWRTGTRPSDIAA